MYIQCYYTERFPKIGFLKCSESLFNRPKKIDTIFRFFSKQKSAPPLKKGLDLPLTNID